MKESLSYDHKEWIRSFRKCYNGFHLRFQIGFTFFMKNLDECVHLFLHHTGSIGKTGVMRRHIGLYQHAVIQFKLRIETDDTGRR